MRGSDNIIRITQLREVVRRFVKERDWEKFHTPKDLALSISIEAAELLEQFQWIKDSDALAHARKMNRLGKIREELADILIYSIDLANSLNIDLSKAVLEKVEKNRRKFPVSRFYGRAK